MEDPVAEEDAAFSSNCGAWYDFAGPESRGSGDDGLLGTPVFVLPLTRYWSEDNT
jgi:hypothetical protein